MIFPTRNAAVIVLSSQDGVNLIGPLSNSIAASPLQPTDPADKGVEARVRAILSSLAKGQLDRTLLTANANAYFTDQAISDYKATLGSLEATCSRSRCATSSCAAA